MYLNKLFHVYNSSSFSSSGEEIMHIHSIRRFKSWFSKTDKEKLESRKSDLKMLVKHFDSNEKEIVYHRQSIKFIEASLKFLEENRNILFLSIEKCNEEDKCFFRIYNMLYCEKEYIFSMESLNFTKIHVSMDVFRPLIEKVNHTKRYSNYKLDFLFKEYQTMLSLFDEFRSKA